MIKSKNFPYVEDDILLDKITSEDIKKEHVDTLNDKEYLKYSQQRFYKHTKESINKQIRCVRIFRTCRQLDNLNTQ